MDGGSKKTEKPVLPNNGDEVNDYGRRFINNTDKTKM